MTWHRGLVVCMNDVVGIVEGALARRGKSCRLASEAGATAYAFAGRDIPDLGCKGRKRVGVAAISGSGVQYIWIPPTELDLTSTTLVPILDLTIGLVLRSADAGVIRESARLRSLLNSVGEPSEPDDDGGYISYRWDLSGIAGDSKFDVASEKLTAVATQLDAAGVAHRTASFEGGFGSIYGELEGSDEVWCGPSACMTLRWEGVHGVNEVTANESGFDVDGDDVPDSPLWDL